MGPYEHLHYPKRERQTCSACGAVLIGRAGLRLLCRGRLGHWFQKGEES